MPSALNFSTYIIRSLGLFFILILTIPTYGQNYLVSGNNNALKRGIYEIELTASGNIGNLYFDTSLEINFTRPDGSSVTVDGFFYGNNIYKARAYCDQIGEWNWESISNNEGLNNRKGNFRVIESSFKGKLILHPEDPYQFAYDNGDWFLHIGDTGYRFVVKSEPQWKEYIDQAAEMGATKIRTWFAQSRGDVEALFSPDRSHLDLEYWNEIENRITYSLENYPHIILQLIIYAEDTEEIKRYFQGDKISQYAARYAQARWSAFPNIHWEISNDREIGMDVPLQGRLVDYKMIDKMGSDMQAREPWGTLITNQQNRFAGYSHVYAPWSDIITLEDEDQVTGTLILEYRKKRKQPVVLDEDRYELYRAPANRRYYFRRYMWASLLSGGHATYGGLRTYEPYDGNLSGVGGYFDANQQGKLYQGAHDFKFIHQFFNDTKLTLVNMRPNDAIAGNDPLQWKCIRNDNIYIVYVANPDGQEIRTDNPGFSIPIVTMNLPEGDYSAKWFNPQTGGWTEAEDIQGGEQVLKAPPDKKSFGPGTDPASEDRILLIERK